MFFGDFGSKIYPLNSLSILFKKVLSLVETHSIFIVVREDYD